jgi:hypothetical protein
MMSAALNGWNGRKLSVVAVAVCVAGGAMPWGADAGRADRVVRAGGGGAAALRTGQVGLQAERRVRLGCSLGIR